MNEIVKLSNIKTGFCVGGELVVAHVGADGLGGGLVWWFRRGDGSSIGGKEATVRERERLTKLFCNLRNFRFRNRVDSTELGTIWLTHRVISDRVHRLLVTLSYFRPDRFVQLISLIPILILLLYFLVSGCLTSLC